MPKDKLTVTVERTILEWIKDIAKDQNRSMSNMVEELLKKALQGDK
jgi:hypothetical protein